MSKARMCRYHVPFHALGSPISPPTQHAREFPRIPTLDPGLAEPVLEASLGESGLVAGHECALLQFYAEVARLRIGDHFAWIAAFPEQLSDEFVQTELLWPRHFNDAVDRRSYGDTANLTRDILSCHGLDQNGCESHRVAVRRIVGYSLDELEELRSADDRVLDRRSLDQFLLGDLGTEVATFGEAFGSHDRQRDVMAHACRRFSIKEVAGRCLEEVQHCRVLERWGVRHVYDHSGTGEGFGQALARERVDASVW